MKLGEVERLRGELSEFAADVFASSPRRDQRRWGGCYLPGLMPDGRCKPIQPMAERLPDGNMQAAPRQGDRLRRAPDGHLLSVPLPPVVFGNAAHRVFASTGQEAFFEEHVRSLRIRVWLRQLQGRRRQVLGLSWVWVENDRWIAFRSHVGMESFYCRPGTNDAYRKGVSRGGVDASPATATGPSGSRHVRGTRPESEGPELPGADEAVAQQRPYGAHAQSMRASPGVPDLRPDTWPRRVMNNIIREV